MYQNTASKNDEFVINSKGVNLSTKKGKHDDSDSSRFESDAQSAMITSKKGVRTGKSSTVKKGIEPMTVKSEDPRDKVLLPQNTLTFE